MKILIINYRYFISGGPEQYMFRIISALENAGHTVIPFSVKSKRNRPSEYESFFADPMGGQDAPYFDDAKKTLHMSLSVISRLYYSFHVRSRLKRLISITKPDIAYILHHYNKLSPSVIDACYHSHVPVVLRLSDFFLICPQALFLSNSKICEDCLKKGLFSCVQRKCIKGSIVGSAMKASALFFHRYILRIYNKVDAFVCTNNFMHQKMLLSHFESNKIHTIQTFASIPKYSQTFKKNDTKYILYVGRFSHEKGIDILINAFAQSRLWENGFELHLAGGTTDDIKWHQFNEITQTNLKKQAIKCLGFLDNDTLQDEYFNCLFTVVPSRCYDNLPNCILESYAHNKAVVGTNLGSIPEFVINHETGLLFNNEDVNSLTCALKTLCLDNDLLTRLTKNIEPFLKQFSEQKHLDKLVALFESVKRKP